MRGLSASETVLLIGLVFLDSFALALDLFISRHKLQTYSVFGL